MKRENRTLTVYLAPQIVTQNSLANTEALEATRAKFPTARILAPTERSLEDTESRLQMVKASDIIVFPSGLDGSIGKVVHDEILLANALRKPVWLFNPERNRFSLHFCLHRVQRANSATYATVDERVLTNKVIAIVDIETTGMDGSRDSILEIAAVGLDLRSLKPKILFNSVCNPGLPREALEGCWICQNGFIESREILDAASDSTVSKGFRRVLGNLPWTSYNTDFDGQFLSRKPWQISENRLPCIMVAAKPACAIPHPEYGLKLPTLEEATGILANEATESHRALPDAMNAAKVLTHLIGHGHYGVHLE